MKIVHTADIHLGTELYGHYDPLTGASSRLQDFAAALDRAVDYAIQQRIDLFLFAGDAYKTRDPSPTQQREFALRALADRKTQLASVPNDLFEKSLSDVNPRVRLQAAVGLGRLGKASAGPALCHVAMT